MPRRPFSRLLPLVLLVSCSADPPGATAPPPPPAAPAAASPPAPAVPPSPPSDDDPSAFPGPTVRAWHGMSMANLKDPVPGAPPTARCQVTHVYRGSPAETHGIRKGDHVLELDGAPVQRFQDVGKALKGRPPGSRHAFVLLRDGGRVKVDLVLGSKPADLAAFQRQKWIGSPHAPFEVRPLAGKGPLRSKDLKARLVVLDFWATWCAPCRAAMPRLDALQKRYRDKGLRVVGVTSEEEPVVRRYLDEHPVSYAIGIDPFGEVKQDYEVSKLPTLVVIGGDGRVLARATGSEGGVEDAERLAADRLR